MTIEAQQSQGKHAESEIAPTRVAISTATERHVHHATGHPADTSQGQALVYQVHSMAPNISKSVISDVHAESVVTISRHPDENNMKSQPNSTGHQPSQKIGQIPVPYRTVVDTSHRTVDAKTKIQPRYRPVPRPAATNRVIYPNNRSSRSTSINSSMISPQSPSLANSEQDYDDKDDKQGANGPTRGLRQFSLRVCKKVEERGITSYNEVADELVKDLGHEIGKGDQKNIRRRVYDALNVLMAMEIIRKEKKEIIWLGLPNGLMQDLEAARKEKQALQTRLVQKKKMLQDMILRQTALKNLIQRNRMREEQCISGAIASGIDPSTTLPSPKDILHLPFILINAPKDCRVNCEMLEDRSHYYFEFDSQFMIHEDIEILKLMGMCQLPATNTNFNIATNAANIIEPQLNRETGIRTNHLMPDIDPILSLFQEDTRNVYQGMVIHGHAVHDARSVSIDGGICDGVDPKRISPVKRTKISAEWNGGNPLIKDRSHSISSPVVSHEPFRFTSEGNENMMLSYDPRFKFDPIGASIETSLASDPNPEVIARQKSLNRHLTLR